MTFLVRTLLSVSLTGFILSVHAEGAAPAPAKAESPGVSHPVNIVATKVRANDWKKRIFTSRIGLLITKVGVGRFIRFIGIVSITQN